MGECRCGFSAVISASCSSHCFCVDTEKHDNPKTKSSGLWKITDLGKKFVNKQLTVCEKVRLFNNKAWGFEGGQIDIVQALGNKFNYTDLMNDNGKD